MRFSLGRNLLPALFTLSLITLPCPGQEAAKPAGQKEETVGKKGAADQKDEPASKKEPALVCDQQRGMVLVWRQSDEAKALHKSPADLLIMTQAADQLWPWQEKEARELLSEALDLTDKYFRGPPEDVRGWKQVWTKLENPHFAVINVISRRDPEWARQLADRIKTDEEKFSLPSTDDFDPAGRRLGAATAILPMDAALAINLARSSLRYPASPALLNFLLLLAAIDQRSADKLYEEAVRANDRSWAGALVNLAPYPFMLKRVVCKGDY
ncbi:MAG TPA: hypothetical protein VFD58_16325 [Blastocatellia bacterium]|nr:hypothetical protein [Blastocatellia bacterium]